MNQSGQIIKVKKLNSIMLFVVSFGIFPIVFFVTLNLVEQDYLTASLITLSVYFIAGILFVRRMKKQEDVYAITANQEFITIRNHSVFLWKEIIGIETFWKIPPGRRSYVKYIKFDFENGKEIVLNTNSYDMDYEELKRELNKLRSGSIT